MVARQKRRRPRRRFPGISAVFSGGEWKWRAVLKRDGKQIVGPLHAGKNAQRLAHQDYEELANIHGRLPRVILTLEHAVRKLEREAESFGMTQENISKSITSHGNALKRFFKPDTRLTDIDVGEVKWLITEALSCGRKPNGIRQKLLPLLARCFEAADLPNPVKHPEIRKLLRTRLRYQPPKLKFFEPDELRNLIRRMRTETILDGAHKIVPRERERHADIIELLATSGIRAGELGRIRIEDIDLRRSKIAIESKDKGHPRHVAITTNLRPIAKRLIATAKKRGQDLLVPGGLQTLGTICCRWKKWLGESRLSGRVLRHSCGTGMLYADATITDVRDQLGHRTLAMTTRYVHAISSHQRDAAERWASQLASTEADESATS